MEQTYSSSQAANFYNLMEDVFQQEPFRSEVLAETQRITQEAQGNRCTREVMDEIVLGIIRRTPPLNNEYERICGSLPKPNEQGQ